MSKETCIFVKRVVLPSTFRLGYHQASEEFLDLNLLFWDYLFSETTVKYLFDQYVELYKPTDEFKSYLAFVLDNLKTTKAITRDLFSLTIEGKLALYCFKVYYFILSIFNKLDKTQRITLPYGIFFNQSIEKIETVINDDKNIINKFFSHLLGNNKFFKNHGKYVFRIHWENESYVILLLAHMLRKKFDNIQINLDLSDVNEQVDFSFWKDIPLFNKYIDSFQEVYYNSLHNPSQVVVALNQGKKIVTRLFDTKCFWGKCSFCTINSRFLSQEKVETLNKSAIQRIEDLIEKIKKTKGLRSMIFADEAIEASVLIHFAKQLLKHEINIRWNARSRFSSKFTLENCKILAEAGLRFLGFGLESVNPRILKLMNKREREYSKEELNNIFENCDKGGINAHAYFIIGFPSEVKEETDETLKFVDEQLNKRRYFTYSANLFYLMKGSEIYNYPDKYNIKIEDKEEIKLSNINFVDNSLGEKYTRNELAYLSRRAYSKMFFKEKELDYDMVQLGYNFWDFLDRTGIFYEHKVINSCNPYRFERSIDNLDEEILNQHFNLLPLFITKDGLRYEYYNVMNEKRVIIKEEIRELFIFFVNTFDKQLTLGENIIKCFRHFDLKIDKKEVLGKIKGELFEKYLIKLIKDSYLYSYKA